MIFKASGRDLSDSGIWLNPRIVKGNSTIADLIAYGRSYDKIESFGIPLDAALGTNSIQCPADETGSSVSVTVPISLQMVKDMEIAKKQEKFLKTGTSEEHLHPRIGNAQISLSGKWQMAEREPDLSQPFGSGKPRKLPDMSSLQWNTVSVPGSVRSGLLEADVIEDPYWSDNAGKSIWTEKKDWWFRKKVIIPESWSGKKNLVGFDGIDYYSSVWVNGNFLGDHEGMYGGPVYDISSLVNFGKQNEIVVQVHTGGTDEPGKVFKGFIFMKWHYQTDISPRGIWRGARIVSVDSMRLENPFVRTIKINKSSALIEISIDVIGDIDSKDIVSVKGTISGDNFKSDDVEFVIDSADIKLNKTVRYRIRLSDPKLWNPYGMGYQHLYRIKLDADVGGNISDSISTIFGVRTLVFEQNPDLESDVNSKFMCRINGKLISMRGAGGFGAHDQMYRFHNRKDAWFIKAAQSLNFNFIRVHGSGIIATDEFYEMCDRMGMMVWQELMISNMGISGEQPDVWRTQSIQSILRLRNHPSLIRWCGGNEFNPDTTADDTKMIVDMLEKNVAEYDGTRLFNRAAQYVNDPHYADETGFYGGDKPAACTEYSGVYTSAILRNRSLMKFLPKLDVNKWPPATEEKLERYIPQQIQENWDKSRRGSFVFHTALTGRCGSWGWPGDLSVLLPQWVFFGIPETMNEAYQISQVSGGYTASYITETYRSR